QLLIGSVLWTLGILAVIGVCLIQFLGAYPIPHRFIYITAHAHIAIVLAVGGAAMFAGASQIRRSLSAMGLLHARLTSVHRGEAPHVSGRYPPEVQPLVDDLNTLLTEREE